MSTNTWADGASQPDAAPWLGRIEALNDAGGRVRDTGAWISWKFALVFALAAAAAVATNYAIGRFTLPDSATIAALRSEKAALEANIADLAKRDGRIKFASAVSRLSKLTARSWVLVLELVTPSVGKSD